MLFWDARYLHNQHGLNADCWKSLQVVTLQRRLPSEVAYYGRKFGECAREFCRFTVPCGRSRNSTWKGRYVVEFTRFRLTLPPVMGLISTRLRRKLSHAVVTRITEVRGDSGMPFEEKPSSQQATLTSSGIIERGLSSSEEQCS